MSYILTTEEAQLLAELQEIEANDFDTQDEKRAFELVNRILHHLGSPDPVLRDELGYRILATWIYRKRKFTAEQLRHVLTQITADSMLFYRIGVQHTDSVFRRSFSSLVIALILLRDNDAPFLTPEEFHSVLDRVASYCEQEADFRGYVEEGGWAHAAAHVADVLNACAKSRFANAKVCQQIWQSTQNLISHAREVYAAEEDERLARPLVTLITSRIITSVTLCEWLEQVQNPGESYIEKFTVRINWKHLTRSLYFRLHQETLMQEAEERFLRIEHMIANF